MPAVITAPLCESILFNDRGKWRKSARSLILSVLNKRVTANIKVIAGFLRRTIKSHKSSHGTPVLHCMLC